jgi:hypothetical protein
MRAKSLLLMRLTTSLTRGRSSGPVECPYFTTTPLEAAEDTSPGPLPFLWAPLRLQEGVRRRKLLAVVAQTEAEPMHRFRPALFAS